MAAERAMNNKILKSLSVIFALLFFCLFGFSQDTNYWTYQYGTRANLLGGAVIGSIASLSGVFYNPGGIALIEDPETLLASLVFQYPSFTLKNIGDTGSDLKWSTLRAAPSMVAGSFKFPWLKDNWLGYSVFSRYKIDMLLTGTAVETRDLSSTIPGNETYYSNFNFIEKLDEPWIGISWAFRLNDSLGIGVSQYITLRSHSLRYQSMTQTQSSGNKIAMTFDSREYDYTNYRLLWKLGLIWELEKLTLGVTLTTPSIKIYGRGLAGINISIIGQDINGDGQPNDVILADYQEDLEANFPTPLSIGVGANFSLPKYVLGTLNIYASAEWYAGTDKFSVIKTENPPESPGIGFSPFDVTHERNSVLNFGIGLAQIFSDKFTCYFSFRTDYSHIKRDSSTNLAVTGADIYHFAGGTTFTFMKSEWTIGIGYSFGQDIIEKRFEPFDSNVKERLIGLIDKLPFEYKNFTFIFGFSF